MSKHTFRWDSLVFGLFFLAAVGSWAVWKQDLLTPRQLSLTASGVLIALGVLGVAATLMGSRTPKPQATPTETLTTTEGEDHEEARPQQ